MSTLPELRMQLAEAKITRQQAKNDYQTRKAICEYQALLAGGPNKEVRDAAAAHALRNDPAVVEALDTLREAEAACEHLEAEVAGAEDTRRQARLLADERHTVALERLAASWEGLAGMPLVQATGRAEVNIDEWFRR
jgi:hypothetical protein